MNEAAHIRYQQKPFPGSSHTWALSHCEGLQAHVRVLDIGCGSGVMGAALGERGIKDLFAVEVDAEARKHAAPYYRAIENSLDAFAAQKFDLIFILDVLEHLTDPETFLRSACDLVRPGGRILISVPNVAHWSVRFQLLFGFFTYTRRGILDRTHFRFFTRRSFKQFIRGATNFRIRQLAGSTAPFEFVLPERLTRTAAFRGFSTIRVAAAQLLPGLLAYQHLAVLERESGA